jgi:hypothetical protein
LYVDELKEVCLVRLSPPCKLVVDCSLKLHPLDRCIHGEYRAVSPLIRDCYNGLFTNGPTEVSA